MMQPSPLLITHYVSRLPMPDILIGAHRGAMCYAPENTLPAFEIAIEQGTYRIECDIRRTSDGILILMHDPTLDRTTNGKGAVAGLTLSEIRNHKCGDDVAIPTFKEALRCAKGRARLLVELKDSDIAEQVIEECTSEAMADECTIISFDEDNLRAARKAAPDIARGFFHVHPGEVSLENVIADFDPLLLVVWPDAATAELVSEARRLGLHVRCGFQDRFTYEEASEIFDRMAEMGVGEMSCGRPDWIAKMISEMEG